MTTAIVSTAGASVVVKRTSPPHEYTALTQQGNLAGSCGVAILQSNNVGVRMKSYSSPDCDASAKRALVARKGRSRKSSLVRSSQWRAACNVPLKIVRSSKYPLVIVFQVSRKGQLRCPGQPSFFRAEILFRIFARIDVRATTSWILFMVEPYAHRVGRLLVLPCARSICIMQGRQGHCWH